jgi:hypothetical protein
MTKDSELSSRERHLVVVFDICSSTTILEDLKHTDNLGAWRNLLISLKDYLLQKGAPLHMDLYKFIGDGWVLLFPISVPKVELLGFLAGLSNAFETQFDAAVKPLLSQKPSPVGVMYGVDSGELVRMLLGNKVEYTGRAITVASMLQRHTTELRGGPAYKALFSKNSYNWPAAPPAGLAVEALTASLRDLSPSNLQCFVWDTTDPKLGRFTGAMPSRPRAS